MTYYLYHIPGKKIGITKDLQKRVEDQQGYNEGEYEIIMKSDNIEYISEQEIYLQKLCGYRVDETPYNKLKFNKKENDMNINVTEATTTFPCPVNKLKGQLMDNVGMRWETEHGGFVINKYSIDWIMKNVQVSRYNKERSYVYNKAFARFYDNHQTHDILGGNLADAHMRERYPSNGRDQYNGKTLAGGLSPERVPECCDEHNPCTCGYMSAPSQFDLIREWADERGLYDKGDVKTQTLKLMEEAGEICKATLKEDRAEIIDGIGDCVVVLTNLAELHGVTIENCIDTAYKVIKNRTGKMVNGTYKKD
jgi:NTP pyrophosphatase (non-canonical NTP hydrolase)